MHTRPCFTVAESELLHAFAGQPLAWMQSLGQPALASPLPLLLQRQGEHLSLWGHIARANPLVEALRADSRAQVLWLGLHGYQSPSWLSDRSQAPTWVYQAARLAVRVVLQDDPAAGEAAVGRLAVALEAGHPEPWRVSEMGARLARLLDGIVAFEAEVVEIVTRFKLGQDEAPELLDQAIAGFSAQGLAPLAQAMRAAADRGHR